MKNRHKTANPLLLLYCGDRKTQEKKGNIARVEFKDTITLFQKPHLEIPYIFLKSVRALGCFIVLLPAASRSIKML